MSVLPIVIIVLILNFTITHMDSYLIYRFLLGALLIILGLSIFLFGADIGITPIGSLMGHSIATSNRLWVIGIAGIILGFLISIAEPDLHVLAGQVNTATGGIISKSLIVSIVSIGVAILVAIGLYRIVYNKPLYKVLTIIYGIIFAFAIFTSPEFLAISFDASAATTGAMTVPFILALGLGVSSLKVNKNSEEDSFGLLALASSGAILSVLIMGLFNKNNKLSGNINNNVSGTTSVLAPFTEKFSTIVLEVFIALLPLLILFFIFNYISFKLPKKKLKRILKGLFYAFLGLVLFLLGVNAGFMDVGKIVGYSLGSLNNQWIIIFVSFVLGLVVILAEPAVYVLTMQIEDVTSGYVKRKLVMIALSIGVAFAVSLSMIRILVPGIKLWHYLLPGYIVAIILTYFVPKLFVGMAFDSGGVASGPMSATFLLAFTQGAAQSVEGADVIIDGFGVIAMVALTPLIALQVLGLIFQFKSTKGGHINEK